MDLELLWERARIIRETRAFFDQKGYLEVDTPLLTPDLIPETCLEVFETAWLPPQGSRQKQEKLWLVPSPEIWMKRLIAKDKVNLYQICKCFRNTESRGQLHNPEFTMLEYYAMDANYLNSLALTEDLFRHLLANVPGVSALKERDPGLWGSLQPPFERITMEEAFQRWAGFSLYAAAADNAMEGEARRLGLEPPPHLDTAALYDLIFIHKVEPSLPRDRPVVLLDYPAFVPCLAQNHQNTAENTTKERWELYINGIELANCYSEEANPDEIRRFFETEGSEKQKNALVKHKIDENYWKMFQQGAGQGFPRCSGTAMGLDRLIMALSGKSHIDMVMPFLL
jgi:lysyl-tRNA synthetase class 2